MVVSWKQNIRVDPNTYVKLLQKKAKMEEDLRVILKKPKAKISMPKMIAYVVRNGWEVNYDDLKRAGKFRWE